MKRLFDEYFSLLNRKLDIVTQVKSLIFDQYNLIETDAFDELNKNFDNVKKLVRVVDSIDEQIYEFDLNDISYDDKMKAADIGKQIEMIIHEISINDMKLKEIVKTSMKQCKSEINEISAHRKSIRGYGHMDYHYESAYFDKKS